MQPIYLRKHSAPSVKTWLSQAPAWTFVLYVSLSSFMLYSCMYGFRKPFTSASYSSYHVFGISYKVVLVISQVLGYMLGKFYGIKFIAGIVTERRAITIVKLVAISWIALLFFGWIGAPYNFLCLFVNGFPLAMVWGLVFGYLEGRRVTEVMAAVLASSFVFASGFAKTIGKWIMVDLGIGERWMPFTAGLFFIVPLLITTWLLNQTPAPSPEDQQARTVREPMDKKVRTSFIKRFGFALAPVIIAYAMLTILRDFDEDFANELWTETGYQNNAGIFAQTSTIISVFVLAITGSFFLIRNNYRAFQLNNVLIIAGFTLAALSTFLFHTKLLTPVQWIVCASAGLYLGYVPYNCFYFERLLAAYKVRGNVGFVIYIADAFGYLGTVLVLLLKEFFPVRYSWVSFFTWLFYCSAAMGIALVIWSSGIFARIYKRETLH